MKRYQAILGAGPLRSELGRLAQDEGVAQQVRFVGFQKIRTCSSLRPILLC
jgi:hypothetical protein